MEIVAHEVQERLNEVNRTFTEALIVSGFGEAWREMLGFAGVWTEDTPVLDVSEEAHDLVLHLLGLHWADDPVGQIVQSRRALRPDGLFVGVLFGGQTLQELRAALAEAETRLTGGLSPRIAPMAEIRDLGGLMQRAGLALPVADSVPLTVSYDSLTDLVRDLRGMAETNALAQRHKATPPRALFALTEEIYRENFADPQTGRLRATFEMIFLTGWAPDASQQKPLRPGSAQQRLADALGTKEQPTGDAAPSV